MVKMTEPENPLSSDEIVIRKNICRVRSLTGADFSGSNGVEMGDQRVFPH